MKSKQRKRRPVMKKMVTTNAKGFKITKEVETDESYTGSSDENEGPIVSAAQAKKTGAKRKEASTVGTGTGTESEKASTSKASKAASKSNTEIKSKAMSRPAAQTSLGSFFSKPKTDKKS